MSLGFSKSWPDALQNMTGSPVMSAESLIKYFLPLYDFLEQENARTNECVGWGGNILNSFSVRFIKKVSIIQAKKKSKFKHKKRKLTTFTL